MSRTVPARQRQTTAGRTWLSVFAAFALLAVAWSLAMPADGITDERQHLERAYGAVTGQLVGPRDVDPLVHRPGAAFDVPMSLLPPNALCVYFPNYHQDQSWVAQAASCQDPAPATHARERVVPWVGRYNPLYYLAVGGPLRFWPDMTGIVLSRILAALLSSAFAATAVTIAIRTRRPMLVAALLTVLTPTTITLNSTVNPNGIEISAALLLWVCLVDLARPGALAPARPEMAARGLAPAAEAGCAARLSRIVPRRSASADSSADPGLRSRRLPGGSLRRSFAAHSGTDSDLPSRRLPGGSLPHGASAGPSTDSDLPSRRLPGGSLRRGTSALSSTDSGIPGGRKSPGSLLRRVISAVSPAEPGSATPSQPALLLLAALSGAVVLTVRAEGPFWFALAVAGSLAAAEPGRVRVLVRWRAARCVAAAWVVTGLLAMAWNVVSGNGEVTDTFIAVHPADPRISTLLRVVAVTRVGGWFSEAFALDVQASWAPMLWAALSAAVLVPVAVLRTRRVAVVALAVAAASLGVTVLLEITLLGAFGWSQYGRYFLPGLAGTAVLLACGPSGELPSLPRRRIPRLFVLGAAFCQLWVLAVEMTRVQAGPDAALNPLGGSWHPAVGSLTVLAVAALGAVALIAVVWAATAAESDTRPPAPQGPTAAPATLPAADIAFAPSQVVSEPANS